MPVAFRLLSLALAAIPHYADAGDAVLSSNGYGFVRFGMTIQEAEVVLMQRPTAPYSKEGCSYVEFKRYPGLRFMVEDGVLTRADADKGVANSAKVQVGMSVARVQRMHPSIEVTPHKYDDDGHYLTLKSADGRSAIVLEESKGKVTEVRAGLKPAVGYVEGCS